LSGDSIFFWIFVLKFKECKSTLVGQLTCVITDIAVETSVICRLDGIPSPWSADSDVKDK